MVGIPPDAPQPLGWPANSSAWVTRHRNICLTFNPPSSPFPLSGPVSRVASHVGVRESATPGPQVRTFPPRPQGHPAPFSLPGQQPPVPGAAAAPTLCTAPGLVPRRLRGLLGELLSPRGSQHGAIHARQRCTITICGVGAYQLQQGHLFVRTVNAYVLGVGEHT